MTLDDYAGFESFARSFGDEIASAIDSDADARFRASGMLDQVRKRHYPSGSMHCSNCGDTRQMLVRPIWIPPTFPSPSRESLVVLRAEKLPPALPIQHSIVPALLSLTCSQCQDAFTLLAFRGPEGADVIVLPEVRRGAGTRNTPASVGYYLDQAERSQSVGACSAAVAMYRSALEMLLFEQGYQIGMLGKKVAAVEADKAATEGPSWIASVEIGQLQVLKDLANAAIHPNDGDVARQGIVDNQLLVKVEAIVRGLLILVYEVPAQTQAALNALKTATRKITE